METRGTWSTGMGGSAPTPKESRRASHHRRWVSQVARSPARRREPRHAKPNAIRTSNGFRNRLFETIDLASAIAQLLSEIERIFDVWSWISRGCYWPLVRSALRTARCANLGRYRQLIAAHRPPVWPAAVRPYGRKCLPGPRWLHAPRSVVRFPVAMEDNTTLAGAMTG